MQESYIIGIDIGTGSTKAVSVDQKGNILYVAQQGYPTFQPQLNYSEQDPDSIWKAFKSCISQTVDHLGYPPFALSLSSAMHSIIPVDENGTALMPLITWADGRSETIADTLRAGSNAAFIYETTGTPIHAMAPLSKMMWIKQHQPAIYEQTYKFVSIKEFLWFKLFGAFEIDYSIASATGLFDIKRLAWSALVIHLAGLDSAKLSTPVNTDYQRQNIIRDVSSEMGISDDTRVIIGASDGCCANLGSAVTNASAAALTIGTSAAVRVTSTVPIFNFKAMTFNYLLNADTFVCGGPVNNGGSAINWAIEQFVSSGKPFERDYERFFSEASEVPLGADRLIFLPYLNGERAPHWDAAASAAFIGLKPHHTPAHFLRAVLEGVCFALNEVLVTLEKSVGQIRQLHVSGGFINSPFWLQLLADLTGKRLVIVQSEDASAIGAAILASRAIFGASNSLEQAVLSRDTDYIEPDSLKHEQYKLFMPLFAKLYDDLKVSMHLLNQINR
jgi:gluconokinase